MKKLISLGLVGVMALSMIPMAFATTDYTNGTQVSYNAEDPDGDGNLDNVETWTVTVPALLTPGGAAGTVTASGTLDSSRKLVVTAPETVTLTNSINANDQKVLDVDFDDITMNGDNTQAVSATADIAVAEIEDALFGTWSGTFNYTAGIVDAE